MTRYNNRRSGVEAYSYSSYFITVRFKTGGIYTYTYDTAGAEHIENMKFLADTGVGLNTYINKNHPGFIGQDSSFQMSVNRFPA